MVDKSCFIVEGRRNQAAKLRKILELTNLLAIKINHIERNNNELAGRQPENKMGTTEAPVDNPTGGDEFRVGNMRPDRNGLGIPIIVGRLIRNPSQ